MNVFELPLSEFNVGTIEWPEAELRSANGPSAYFTELESLEASSVLVCAPRGFVWGSVPGSTLSRGRGHFAVPGQGAWQDAADRAFLRPGVDRDFAAELKRHKLKPSALRYGLLPFVGGTSLVGDKGYSPSLPPLWQQWFKVYLIPQGLPAQKAFVRVLSALLAERGAFALRRVPDERLTPGIQHQFEDDDTSDEALLWSYHSSPSWRVERPPFACQARAIDMLSEAVRQAEAGSLPDWHAMSPAFNDWSARVVLADVRPQSVRELNAELISSYRVRLMRLTQWPVFCQLLKQVPERMRSRLAGFEPRREPLPYDIAAEAQVAVDETCKRYPGYASEPFDALYAPAI